MKGGVVGSVLTRSENVDVCAVVREPGHVVVDLHSGDSGGTRSATGGEAIGTPSMIPSLDRYQNSMHRSFV